MDLRPGAFVEIENAALPSQARLKCPKCHKHAVQWHPPSPERRPLVMGTVSDETASALFRLMRLAVEEAR